MKNESNPTVVEVYEGAGEGADALGDEAEGGPGSLIELVLAAEGEAPAPEAAPPRRIDGIVIGALSAIGGPAGGVLVDFAGSGSSEGVPARTLAALSEADIGRSVALMFEGGDPQKPTVLGLIQGPLPAPRAPAPEELPAGAHVEADGERLVFTAEREIVLRCGEASITLTRAGKVLIRGAYLLTRSSGVNRIQGGSVQIN